jgi:transcriptional regulator GlxA family with amidase domain
MQSMSPSSPKLRQVRAAHRVVMLGYPRAQILDITGPLEVFARTARWLRDHHGFQRDAYQIELVAPGAGWVETSGGLGLLATRRYGDVRRADTLLIAGGIGHAELMQDQKLLRWIRDQANKVDRIGSICTGALLLAAAGLLDGKTVATHWAYCDRLAAVAKNSRVERDAIYVQNGKLYTSAGVTAGMDMALAMVEADFGKATALAIAQELVMYLKRPGGQSQFSRHLSAQRRDDVFGNLELWMLDHLDADLSVENLARRIDASPRHFARLFMQRMGTTPAAYVRRLRVEHARSRIESGARRAKQVARECGFADEQSLRRAFRQILGVTLADYRSRFAG